MLRFYFLKVGLRQFVVGLLVGLLTLFAAGRLDAAVRVALLQTDLKQSGDIVSLVEASLTAAGKVTLVERQQVEKILHEQDLQTVLGADAVVGRAAMGKLLQADLLVFIQPHEKPELSLGVVISETHHGLRLIRQAIPCKDSQSAATALQTLIDAAVEKQSRAIREVFAVPPLISDDLGFEFDHLKGAYAKVIEGALSEQQGVVVVELDEARAVAKEITLSNADDVHRPLPLYVMGHYRTGVAKDARIVSIDVKLMRGDRELASVAQADLALDRAGEFLREAARSFLAKCAAGSVADADPRAEATELATRAHLMMSLGSWQEALDLIEAALLVDPQRMSLHHDAVEVLLEFVADKSPFRPHIPLAIRSDAAVRVDYYRRGLDHIESYLCGVKLDGSGTKDQEFFLRFTDSLDSWGSRVMAKRTHGRVDQSRVEDLFLPPARIPRKCFRGSWCTRPSIKSWTIHFGSAIYPMAGRSESGCRADSCFLTELIPPSAATGT